VSLSGLVETTERLEIQLCGGVRVRIGDERVDLSKTARQGRLALAYLVLHRDRPVTREELMEHIWDAPDPRRVSASLTQTLSRLRSALGRETLTRLPSGAVWLRGDLLVDLEEAEAALGEGREACARGAWDRALHASDVVLAKLTGDFLAGDEANWLEPVRRRVAEIRVEALELAATAALRTGSPIEAEAAARRAVAAAGTRETSWALLMEAQAANGDAAQASATFDTFRRRLRDEFGLTPTSALIERHDRLLEGESTSRPAAAAPGRLPTRLEQAARTRFVGRGDELAGLRERWRSATAAGPEFVLISGESGIGKTRLIAQLANELHGDAAVLYGRCDEDLGAPYQPWIDIFDQYLRTLPRRQIERHVAHFGTVLGRLAPALAGRAPPTADPEAERYLLFNAATHLICEAAGERPALLVLDDLHWADEPTLLLLRHLVTRSMPMRILVVGAVVGDIPATLVDQPPPPRLELGRFAESDIVLLMESTAARRLNPSEHSLVEELMNETGGLPFFVNQILRHLIESGAIRTGSDGWRLTRPVAEIELPDTVREVVTRRVLGLGDGAAHLLRIAAVIGREFDIDVLARVAQRSEDEVLDLLDDAVRRARLVVEVSGTRLSFTHAATQQALLQVLGKPRAARLHLRIAQALEAIERAGGDARPTDEARHRLASEAEPARALAAAERAGRWALDRLAPQEAARWFDTARRLLERHDPGDEARRCSLLVCQGDAERQAGTAAFRQTLLEAARVAQELGDTELLVRAVLANTRGFESASGQVDAERVATLEAAIERLGDRDGRRRARLLAQLQLEQSFAVSLAERRRLSDEALRLAERSGDADTLAHVLWARHAVLWVPDLLDEHRANAARLARVAAELNDPVARFWAACDAVLTSMWAGDIERVDLGLETMGRIVDRVGQPILRWVRLWYGAWRAHLAADLDEAEGLALAAAQVGAESGQPDAAAFYANQHTTIQWERGRLGESVPLLEGAVAANPGLPVFRAWLALAQCEAGDPQAARRVLEAELATGFRAIPWDIVSLTTASLYADVATRLRHRAAAGPLRAMLAPYADQIVFNATSVHGSVARFLGGLAAAEGDLRAADDHFADAARVHEALGARGLLARTHVERGVALVEAGGGARGRRLLEQAHTAAGALGMEGVRARAEQALAAP
jgi:DNA-binding SARP family transcriptional activator